MERVLYVLLETKAEDVTCRYRAGREIRNELVLLYTDLVKRIVLRFETYNNFVDG